MLAERLGGRPGLWPLQPDRWDEDTFYGLIEVLHDLVGPLPGLRQAPFYAVEAGRRLYRWRVNRLLDTADIGLRLADTGEDAGRLVETVDPARAELLDRVLVTPKAVAAGHVRHAVALFRGAVPTNTTNARQPSPSRGVLEDRRELLKAALFRKPTKGPCSDRQRVRPPHNREDKEATSTRRSGTGCSGGTWPLSSSPTGYSPARTRRVTDPSARRH